MFYGLTANLILQWWQPGLQRTWINFLSSKAAGWRACMSSVTSISIGAATTPRDQSTPSMVTGWSGVSTSREKREQYIHGL